jgi:hypothetical protein
VKDIDSPAGLARVLTKMFPAFEHELDGEEITSYHQVIQSLTPRITGYLRAAPEPTLHSFCNLVNEMVTAGGSQENAFSTCLLEHASQVKVRDLIRPHLSMAARQKLR